MKVIIAGSRWINDYKLLLEAVNESHFEITTVVSGLAKGPDTLGLQYAKENNITTAEFKPNWDTLGKRAGIVRNEEMGNYADALIAIYDGVSKGTAHMINYMKKLNKPVYVKKVGAMPKVLIYTDGSCLGNPGPGGIGIILYSAENKIQKEFSEGYKLSTNNRMEILSVIKALEKLKTRCDVELFTDSQYVVNTIEKGWLNSWKKNNWKKKDGKPALNRDLWEQVDALLSKHSVKFHWVKGHDGHSMNERCDVLAKAAASQKDLPEDVGYVKNT